MVTFEWLLRGVIYGFALYLVFLFLFISTGFTFIFGPELFGALGMIFFIMQASVEYNVNTYG